MPTLFVVIYCIYNNFRICCVLFYLNVFHIPILYPRLWAVVQTFLIAFPSSYLVEREFNAITNLLTKKRQRLQITNHGDLRMLGDLISNTLPI